MRSLTINYALCEQCGQQKNMMHMLRVDGIMVHGPRHSARFSGRFCSPACLDVFLCGALARCGVIVESKGSVMRWPVGDDVPTRLTP